MSAEIGLCEGVVCRGRVWKFANGMGFWPMGDV